MAEAVVSSKKWFFKALQYLILFRQSFVTHVDKAMRIQVPAHKQFRRLLPHMLTL